jgi:hypothetical protein
MPLDFPTVLSYMYTCKMEVYMTHKLPLPPTDVLRSMFRYDAETGRLYWLPRPGDPRWNRVFAGKEAGGIDGKGYVRIRTDGNNWNAHRVIWKLVYDEEPEFVDHISGDRSNNCLTNLRSVNKTENARNARVGKNNRSGYNGVHWVTRERKWRSCIYVSGKKVSLGDFSEKQDAVAARKKAEVKYGYHPNHGRTN